MLSVKVSQPYERLNDTERKLNNLVETLRTALSSQSKKPEVDWVSLINFGYTKFSEFAEYCKNTGKLANV
jgi:hypothetical protein